MSVQVQLRRDTAANIAAAAAGAQGEPWVDTTNNRIIVNDGSTVGGWPAAKLSEVPVAPSPHGATAGFAWVEQLITCSGPTTNIPLGETCVIYGVDLKVITSVTGCASITINDSQNGNEHWGSGIGISAGSTNPGGATPGPYYNGSTTLALAAVGGGASFTGGTVRVSVLVMTITPPTS
jgi:hypothetical protein